MSADYQAIQWNKLKITYDVFIIIGIIGYVATYMAVSYFMHPQPRDISQTTLLIRALGTCAFIMLHIILFIGPLARLSSVFKPLLYNRRHLGVSMILVASGHLSLAIVWYHGYGVILPFASLITSNPNYADMSRFPFEIYGLAAYAILLIMALTSHDFWLKFFTAPIWKLLHIGVYFAYFFLMAHVLFGFVQTEGDINNIYVLGAAASTLAGLHILVAIKELLADKRATSSEEWVSLCPARSIENNRAKGFTLSKGDKIAVFRYDKNRIVAVANACAHQNGPLCEGMVVNGRIVCPWHGYEYMPENGRSPAPFTEKIPTYNVRIKNGIVQINQTPNAAGKKTKAAIIK